jgi:hypothetical protein
LDRTTWFLGFAEKRKLAEVLAKVTEVNESLRKCLQKLAGDSGLPVAISGLAKVNKFAYRRLAN